MNIIFFIGMEEDILKIFYYYSKLVIMEWLYYLDEDWNINLKVNVVFFWN